MIAQRRTFALLSHDPLEPDAHSVAEHHRVQSYLWVIALDESLQLASRTSQGYRRLAARLSAQTITRLLDKPLELVGLLSVALSRLLCRYLERNRKKLLLIAFNMRVQERDNLLSRHSPSLFSHTA
ncbi:MULTISPECIES: hypothetical protein [Sphingomonas]|uniref:hypothetical protein n=1 Tax=Sphingomonas TaxID=13687 RepID=UPI001F07BC6E|nr:MULTISPECIES: hypothetical protein [Sphingomonas]